MNARLADLLAGSEARSASRCCFLLHVRPERLEEYVAAHQQVWEEMREALHDAGWRNYTLFLRAEDGLVVGYFEADDCAAAQAAIARTAVSERWEAAMAEYFTDDLGKQELTPYFHLA